MSKIEKQRFLSNHWSRIKELQNSNDPYKWELIDLLSREYEQVKGSL
jgi:hypothetical protein